LNGPETRPGRPCHCPRGLWGKLVNGPAPRTPPTSQVGPRHRPPDFSEPPGMSPPCKLQPFGRSVSTMDPRRWAQGNGSPPPPEKFCPPGGTVHPTRGRCWPPWFGRASDFLQRCPACPLIPENWAVFFPLPRKANGGRPRNPTNPEPPPGLGKAMTKVYPPSTALLRAPLPRLFHGEGPGRGLKQPGQAPSGWRVPMFLKARPPAFPPKIGKNGPPLHRGAFRDFQPYL